MPIPKIKKTAAPQESKTLPAPTGTPTVPPESPLVPDEGKKKSARWRFWFLITLSILLVVVFVFYLPLRFQNSATQHDDTMQGQMDHGETDERPEMAGQMLSATDDHEDEPGIPENHHEEEEEAEGHHDEPGTPADHAHESEQLKPLVSPVWWLLLVVSLIITALLSLGIYKFINVKK